MKNRDDKRNVMISVRLTEKEKSMLELLAYEKGCAGITGLLRLLATARRVEIKL